MSMLFACLNVTVFAQTRQANSKVRLPIVDGADRRSAHMSFGEVFERYNVSHGLANNVAFDSRGRQVWIHELWVNRCDTILSKSSEGGRRVLP